MQVGWTAVISAAVNGHLSVVEYLAGRGADIEAKSTVRAIV
jgi:ankyrin repeat protein